MLQQYTGKFEIACSTTVVEFKTTMLLAVLMERCNFKLFVCLMTLPVHSVVALLYVLDFTTPLYLSRNIASLGTSSYIPRYVRCACNVMRVGDEVSDVMSAMHW